MRENKAGHKLRKLLIVMAAALVIVLFAGCGKAAQDADAESGTESAAVLTEQTEQAEQTEPDQPAAVSYTFRYDDLLQSHYEKHGIDMGFDSPEEYLAAANAVIANPGALTKTEAEDGDMVYYVEETNEFVVLSTDGYIRTYFLPDSGRRYFDRQ